VLAECILVLFRGADPDDPEDAIKQQIGALRIAEFLNISIASKTQKPKR
jgi:hypothetical protein